MRVRCPDCEAGYEIEDAMIGPAGRSLRCAACGGVWWVGAPLEALLVPDPAAPAVSAPPESFAVAEPEHSVRPGREEEAPEPKPVAEPPPAEPAREPAITIPRHVAGAPFLAATRGVDDRPAPPPPPPPLVEAAPARTSTGVWVGWVVTFIVLASAAYAAVHYRAAVMAAWPPSEWVYTALGLYKPPG